MGVYIYCITSDYYYRSGILGREYENFWLKLDPSGVIIVKGANYNGYAWDGCSPKFKFKDIYLGTPEAVLNSNTGQSKTYYASLVHDVFYQFAGDLKHIVRRKEADRVFYEILKRDGFRFARFYYFVVRAVSWMFWYFKRGC